MTTDNSQRLKESDNNIVDISRQRFLGKSNIF